MKLFFINFYTLYKIISYVICCPKVQKYFPFYVIFLLFNKVFSASHGIIYDLTDRILRLILMIW